MSTANALLAAARNLTDHQIDELAGRLDDELVGGDPRPTLHALRELGRGNAGRRPDEPAPDPLA